MRTRRGRAQRAGTRAARGFTRPDDTRTTRGFTLLELVLALTIFGFLTLLVYGAFYTGHRAVEKGEASAELSQRLRLAEEIVGRQVRSAVYTYARFDDDSYPYFLGRGDRMSFVSASPQGRGGTGLAVVSYRVADGKLILEERSSFTPDDLYEPPDDARVERAVVLANFSALRFEYLPHEDDETWRTEWDGREDESLPAAVRITVDGLQFFDFQPWVHEIPLMTIAYGWGVDDFQDPPDEEDDDSSEQNEDKDDEEDDDDEDDEGDEE